MSVRMNSHRATISATTPVEATIALVMMDSVLISQIAGLAMVNNNFLPRKFGDIYLLTRVVKQWRF